MKIQRFKEEAEAARIESEKNSVAEGNIRVRSSVNALLNSTDQLQTRSDLMTCLVTTQNTEKMRADHGNSQDKAAKKPLTSIDWKRRIPFRGIQYDVEIRTGNEDAWGAVTLGKRGDAS